MLGPFFILTVRATTIYNEIGVRDIREREIVR